MEWKQSADSAVDPTLANSVEVRGSVFVAEQDGTVECEQAGTWEVNAWGQGINPGVGCDYQDEGNLVWTESDFVNISSSRWTYLDYHLSENSRLMGAVPKGEGETPTDMGPFGGPQAGYGLGPSTHTCLEQNSYLAGTWLYGEMEYGGQLNLRDSLGADTGKIADLHLLWLEGGERVEVLVSSPHFAPRVEVFHPAALHPAFPLNTPAPRVQRRASPWWRGLAT